MNRPLKYSLIVFAAVFIAVCIFIGYIFSLVYTKGLPLDFLSKHIEKKISNNNPGSNLSYNEALLKYNDENGLYLEANRLVYFDSNTQNTFDIDSLWLDFDFLSLWNNENKNINVNLEYIKLFDSNSVELAKGNSLSINIKNENIIKLNIDEVIYKDDISAVYINYLSAEIRNKEDTILNVGNIKYKNIESNVSLDLDSSLIRLNIDSLLNSKKSNFYIKSKLTLENDSSYNIEGEFHKDKNKLIINEFIGDDIYLSEQGNIDLLDGFDKLSVKLNFRAKAGAFNRLVSFRSDLNIQSFIDGFVGWQNFKLDAVFNSNQGNYETVDDSSLLLSGIYDFRKIELPESFDSKLQDMTIYDLAIVKRKNSYEFKINNLKNDFVQLGTGSELILNDNFDHTSITLITSIKREIILNHFIETLENIRVLNSSLYELLNDVLNEDQKVKMNFDLDLTKNSFYDAVQNLELSVVGDTFKINLLQKNNDNAKVELETSIKREIILNHFIETLENIRVLNSSLYELLNDVLNEDQKVKMNFDLDLTKNSFYDAVQNLELSVVGDMFKINLLQKNNDNAKVELETSIKREIILDYIKGSLSQREANNNKFYNFLDRNLYQRQNLNLSFNLNFKEKSIIESISNIQIFSNGSFDSNYIFDDNKNPNYIIGVVSYELEINDLNTEKVYLDGRIDLGNTEGFIRQINLNKRKSEKLIVDFSGYFSNSGDSIFKISSVDSDYDLSGKVKISNTNHIFINDFKINNNRNIDLILSGDLSKRVLNLNITGTLIDLSQNKIEINSKKEYYLDTENYRIKTDNVIFNGPVKVDNFKAGIVKKKSKLSVHSSATFDDHKLSYSREKDDTVDTNIIISDDIAHFVGDSHAAKKLLSDGSIELISIRNLKNLKAEVSIKLNDFVLIDTPVTLKLLSLPSISGLVSIAEGEPGIRFGYGEIKYTETEDLFSNIEAFAVSDSLGLVMDGNIDRNKKIIDMKGEISPMHIVNAIIQKLPIIGNILVGNEGEGMFSIDFSLTGNQDDPDVNSVPLSIIKPRILERAIELVESDN